MPASPVAACSDTGATVVVPATELEADGEAPKERLAVALVVLLLASAAEAAAVAEVEAAGGAAAVAEAPGAAEVGDGGGGSGGCDGESVADEEGEPAAVTEAAGVAVDEDEAVAAAESEAAAEVPCEGVALAAADALSVVDAVADADGVAEAEQLASDRARMREAEKSATSSDWVGASKRQESICVKRAAAPTPSTEPAAADELPAMAFLFVGLARSTRYTWPAER